MYVESARTGNLGALSSIIFQIIFAEVTFIHFSLSKRNLVSYLFSEWLNYLCTSVSNNLKVVVIYFKVPRQTEKKTLRSQDNLSMA
jgi:hypothetical protein